MSLQYSAILACCFGLRGERRKRAGDARGASAWLHLTGHKQTAFFPLPSGLLSSFQIPACNSHLCGCECHRQVERGGSSTEDTDGGDSRSPAYSWMLECPRVRDSVPFG